MGELSVFADTPDNETEERFVREYVVPTIERLGEKYELIFYGRYSTSTSVEGGHVKISFKGDPDAILSEERDKLDSFDYLDEWWAERETETEESRNSEEERDLIERCTRMAAKMNVHYFGEFDEQPPIGDVTEDRFHTPGIWMLIHTLLNGQGYSPEEEADALFLALRDRLARIGIEHNEDHVDELVVKLHEQLDETQERIAREFFDNDG